LIVDGEPNASDKPELRLDECFPESVKYKVTSNGNITEEQVEPIAADARRGRDGKRDALLKIIAGILGVNYDALKQRDQVRQLRKLYILSISVLIFVCIFGFLSAGFYQAKIEAEQQKYIAEVETKKANHNIGLVFAEKANMADKEHKQVRASLFALSALEKVIPGKDPEIEVEALKIANKAINNFVFHVGNIKDYKFTSVIFSPNGRVLVSGSDDNTLRIWDVATGKVLMVIEGHLAPITSVAFSTDGKMLVSSSDDDTLRIWDVVTGKGLIVIKEEVRGVFSVIFFPDGKTLFSGGYDNALRIWDAVTGKGLMLIGGNSNDVSSVAISPDGELIGSGNWDSVLRLWSVTTGKVLLTMEGHSSVVSSITFSPDGKTLASGSWDNTLRLWDAVTGKSLAVIEEHSDTVSSVAFSPDGKTLVSGSNDHTIRLWDVATAKVFAVLEGHGDELFNTVFSPDGKTLLSSSSDEIRLWDVSKNIVMVKYFCRVSKPH